MALKLRVYKSLKALIFRRVGIAHMAYFRAIRCRVWGVVHANENRYKSDGHCDHRFGNPQGIVVCHQITPYVEKQCLDAQFQMQGEVVCLARSVGMAESCTINPSVT